MKKMNFIATLIVGVLTAQATFAQDKKEGHRMGISDLTPEQTDKIKTINKEYKQKVQQLRLDKNEKITRVLTPEQKELFAKRVEARKKAGDKKQENFRAHKKAMLTEEQQAKLKEINTKYGAQIKAVKDKDGLTEEQKTAEIQKIKQEKRKEMKAVWTKEQQESFKKHKQKQHRKKECHKTR